MAERVEIEPNGHKHRRKFNNKWTTLPQYIFSVSHSLVVSVWVSSVHFIAWCNRLGEIASRMLKKKRVIQIERLANSEITQKYAINIDLWKLRIRNFSLVNDECVMSRACLRLRCMQRAQSNRRCHNRLSFFFLFFSCLSLPSYNTYPAQLFKIRHLPPSTSCRWFFPTEYFLRSLAFFLKCIRSSSDLKALVLTTKHHLSLAAQYAEHIRALYTQQERAF